jgi:type II secretory pathway pseudopilin PulG
MKNYSKNQFGFTLVELLLYLGMATILLVGFTLLVPVLLEARLKNEIALEVDEQALQVMTLITQEIRNAESVVSPGVGLSGGSLTLDVVNAAEDPMVFSLNSGALGVTRGGGSFEALTNDKVVVTNLNFKNMSLVDTAGSVRVEFDLEYANNSNRAEFEYGKTYYGAGTLKSSL